MRVIIVDSDERREYEQAMRQRAMERTRQALEKLQGRVAAGKLKQPAKVGAAAERLLQRNHGYRYYSWSLERGSFRVSVHTLEPWKTSGLRSPDNSKTAVLRMLDSLKPSVFPCPDL